MYRRVEGSRQTRHGICFIANASAGGVDGERRLGRLEAWARRCPGPVAVHGLRQGGDVEGIARRAVRSGFSTVVAAGGDGTVAAAAEAVAGTDTNLGIIPWGTFNYAARSLGIPNDPDEACNVICTGTSAEMPVGAVNGKIFLNNASIGAYPSILKQREGAYRRWGRSQLMAHWSTLRALMRSYRPIRVEVRVDGERHALETPLAFVCNSAFQLEELGLEGADAVRGDRLALFVAAGSGRVQMMHFALKLARGQLVRDADYQLFFGREIVLETSNRSRPVARDGENMLMRGPLQFRREERALRVIVPRKEQRAA